MKNAQKENERLVKELYEKYPYPSRQYSEKNVLKNYTKWLTQILGQDLNFWKGKKILEFGCGTGELANGLALNGAKIKAIDFSSSSIKKARELSKEIRSKKISFVETNILDFSDTERYDIVIALGSLHHTINARKGFHIMCKHCKENGLIIVGLYNKYSRFRHRLKRCVLWFCGKDFEKRIRVGKKLFGGIKSDAWLADKYGQVHETYHSINEVLKWFREEGIEFVCSKPKFRFPILDEIKWLIKKESAFFVMVGRVPKEIN